MSKNNEEWYAHEPLIRSHVTDVLPEDHPLAYEQVDCDRCGTIIHAGNNECMTTWIEWGPYKLCGECAVPCFQHGVLYASHFEALAKKEPWPKDE